MPHGSRIALLSALLLTGCHSAPRQPNPLLPPKPVINSSTTDPAKKPTPPTAGTTPPTTGATPAIPTASTGRGGTYSPIVGNENFRRPIVESPTPQPGVMPQMAVPSLPVTSYPSAPAPSPDIAPMNPPGMSGMTTLPPIAEGSGGDLKVPSMMGSK
ncbi:hypothetical protein [Limnoglobus roseus]|uniref:Lipoprotein n=1 Tax=Limnoglobus roseus TaxID=2598579 RepID=A0A5C1AN59_9BACT|nr:hypothetical protein [Limnoglobus roseus]QEL19426.1 hypothetical protein PX52LOC_06498 [Limnoglobus roseus]